MLLQKLPNSELAIRIGIHSIVVSPSDLIAAIASTLGPKDYLTHLKLGHHELVANAFFPNLGAIKHLSPDQGLKTLLIKINGALEGIKHPKQDSTIELAESSPRIYEK